MGTAIDWVKPSFVIFDIWTHSDAQGWVSERPDINLMATVGVKEFK